MKAGIKAQIAHFYCVGLPGTDAVQGAGEQGRRFMMTEVNGDHMIVSSPIVSTAHMENPV